MFSVTIKVFLLVIILFTTSSIVCSQSNLLKNPNADEGNKQWRPYGEAAVDESKGWFVVQNSGHLFQDVSIPPDSVGKFVVLIGHGAGSQIISDGSGKPLIRGEFIVGNAFGGRGYGSLDEQQTVSTSMKANEWVYLWGIYRIPAGPKFIRLFLTQTTHKMSKENVTPVYFDDLGVYIFNNALQAKRFVETTTQKNVYGFYSDRVESKSPCTIKQNELPKIYSFSMGMTEKEVLRPFTKSKIEKQSGNFGRMFLTITQLPVEESNDFIGLHKIVFGLFDGHVYHIYVELEQSPWRNVDEFIMSYPKREKLPPLEVWESTLPQWSKYVICDEVEIQFRLYRYNSRSYFSFIDRNIEEIYYNRMAKELSWRDSSPQKF